MHIKITGRHFDVTEALRKHTEEKLSRLKRYFDRIISIHVIFCVEKMRQIAEATIVIAGGKLHAHHEADSMYPAVDALVDKLGRQLKVHKEKQQARRE